MDRLLSLLVALPALGAIAVLLLPRRHSRFGAIAAASLALSLSLYLHAFPASETPLPWIAVTGSWWALEMGPFQGMLALLATTVGLLVALGGYRGREEHERASLGLTLLSESAMLGLLLAGDALLFYLFWEALLLPMVIVVALGGRAARVRAAMRLLVMSMGGSLAMLLALVVIFRDQANLTGLPSTLLDDLALAQVPMGSQTWLLLAFVLAFGVKSALLPLHAWLADAYTEAPTGATMFMSGVMAKAGVWGFLHVALPLTPHAFARFAPLLGGLAVAGILYGALMALVQTDLKRLLAWGSLSHVNLCLLGVFVGTPLALAGSGFQMFSHGIVSASLFLVAGLLARRRGTRLLGTGGGLGRGLPRLTFVLGFLALGAIGLPGLSGFVGELLVMLGAFPVSPALAIGALMGSLLGAAWMLEVLRRLLFGRGSPANDEIPDLEMRESALFVPILAIVAFLGLSPGLLLDGLDSALDDLLAPGTQARIEVRP